MYFREKFAFISSQVLFFITKCSVNNECINYKAFAPIFPSLLMLTKYFRDFPQFNEWIEWPKMERLFCVQIFIKKQLRLLPVPFETGDWKITHEWEGASCSCLVTEMHFFCIFLLYSENVGFLSDGGPLYKHWNCWSSLFLHDKIYITCVILSLSC